jgi:hypothetical protein
MMARRQTALPDRRLSDLSDPRGRPVVKIEALPLHPGQVVRLVFEQVNSSWRQGVWLGTDGSLSAAGSASPQLVIWTDTAPPDVEIGCDASDGLLRFYNVWDSGRGRHRESLSATSGMAVEEIGDGWRRYSCNDIGAEPNFDKLVFRISVE